MLDQKIQNLVIDIHGWTLARNPAHDKRRKGALGQPSACDEKSPGVPGQVLDICTFCFSFQVGVNHILIHFFAFTFDSGGEKT